jgi:ABC-2 type transport system permease protein
MAPRGDAVRSRTNLFVASSDWITFHTVVSTSADQTAIAPGYLQKDWQKNGRHFYEYSMGATHILDFASWLSARYTVRKEAYKGPSGPVNLEVYYDSAHPYNVDEMLESARAGLDYFQARFSPYQFRQFRTVVPQHRALLGSHRLHHPCGQERRCGSDIFRDRA